jgi:glycosyltransferase involved in cell wall biosynthesis
MGEPLRVLLIGNYVPDRQQSMLRFAEVLQRELTTRGIACTLLQPQPRLLGDRSPARGLGKWFGHIDKYLHFPAILRQQAARHDVVHVLDHSNAMYCHDLADVPHLVTCHDLLAIRSARGEFPQNPTRWSGRRLQAMILRGLCAARLVACVSRATLADLERIAGVTGERTALVPNGLNHPYHPRPRHELAPALAALGLPPGCRYLLHVGGNHWYKHRAGVLRIAGALRRRPDFADLRLVMVGEPLDPDLMALAEAEGIAEHLHPLPGMSNDQLNMLYNGALALLFPSLHEGFGWPIIEAQAAGCPALVSDREPLPEVAGAEAVRFDPLDAEGAATVIAAALPRREQLVASGLTNAARFTTAAMIDGYVGLYRRLRAGVRP